MEISSLSPSTIKIKGKQTSIIVNPVKSIKQQSAEITLFLKQTTDSDPSKVQDARISIFGPGEYEVGGIKISSFRVGDELVHSLIADSVEMLLLDCSVLEKIKDKARDYDVMVINTPQAFDSSLITAFSPSVVLVYGEKAKEAAKDLGKEEISAVSKYTITKEKLPEEMEVVTLQ